MNEEKNKRLKLEFNDQRLPIYEQNHDQEMRSESPGKKIIEKSLSKN